MTPALSSAEARATALIATALLVAVAMTGCSGSGDDGAAQTNSARPGGPEMIGFLRAVRLSAEDDVQSTSGSNKIQIAEVLSDVQLGVAAEDGIGACSELSQSGKKEVADAGVAGYATCEEGIVEIGRRRRKAKQKSKLSRVVSVEVQGNRAYAQVEDPGGKTYEVRFERESGDWTLPTLNAIDSGALLNKPRGPGHDYSDPRGVSQEELVKEVLYDVQGDFPGGRGSSVCFELTEAGRHEIEALGIGGFKECERIVPILARRARAADLEFRRSRILSVRIAGRRATAIVKDRGAPAYRVTFEKLPELGWKLPSLALAEPIDLEQVR